MSSTQATAKSVISGESGGGGGREGPKETKVVETVAYQSSAGQAPGEVEKKPVGVVHEYPAPADSAPTAGGGQDAASAAGGSSPGQG